MGSATESLLDESWSSVEYKTEFFYCPKCKEVKEFEVFIVDKFLGKAVERLCKCGYKECV